MKIAINGAGIAGTALAYWLGKLGHDVLLVERAPQLRTGGFVINLWGIGYDALERMGLLPRLLELQYHSDELRMVDRAGRTRGGYPSSVLLKLANGRMATLARSDIAAAIHASLDARVETLFGDSIAAIDDGGTQVRVEFEHSMPREFDLVIGADGLHARVRQLVFGPDADFEYPMGCHVASFEVAGYRPRNANTYVAHTAPGRYVARFPMRDDRMLFFVLLRDEHLKGRIPASHAERKAALRDALAGIGWEAAGILSALEQVDDIYFDSISQIRMDAWAKGRVALIGDAAACPSLIAGEGAGFALAQAYILAGELHRHEGDIAAATTRYQRRLQAAVARKQKHAESLAASFVPRTEHGVRIRDYATLLMRLPVFPRILMGRYFRDEVALPEYGI
ncbi:FAD-binding domain [Luteimonas sp. MC1750]|uniref:FAD-binding domain n=1 Tax=Luteimonas sp. MC1750 TaxID=2799326 RepID=UPI0018F0F6FC|nr:FAD-binding domain [Luteimonas sp. MC1750]MBJ6985472.1 FAD-binding domain [Luteimonas sp. MC1750]QQO06040.1 FAD-binding domain [Luteimonas sp. MC1750]